MKDEDKTFENEVKPKYDDRGSNDLDVVIGNYKKELYAMQKYKSESIMLQNQLKGTKAIIEDFAKSINKLREQNLTQAKEIDRLNEYVQILEMEKQTN